MCFSHISLSFILWEVGGGCVGWYVACELDASPCPALAPTHTIGNRMPVYKDKQTRKENEMEPKEDWANEPGRKSEG